MLAFPRLPIVALLSLPFAVGGCSSYWTKIGANEDKFGEARGDCVQRAYAEVPAAMVRWPNPDTIYDANTDARDAAVFRCLDERGWRLVERGPQRAGSVKPRADQDSVYVHARQRKNVVDSVNCEAADIFGGYEGFEDDAAAQGEREGAEIAASAGHVLGAK